MTLPVAPAVGSATTRLQVPPIMSSLVMFRRVIAAWFVTGSGAARLAVAPLGAMSEARPVTSTVPVQPVASGREVCVDEKKGGK